MLVPGRLAACDWDTTWRAPTTTGAAPANTCSEKSWQSAAVVMPGSEVSDSGRRSGSHCPLIYYLKPNTLESNSYVLSIHNIWEYFFVTWLKCFECLGDPKSVQPDICLLLHLLICSSFLIRFLCLKSALTDALPPSPYLYSRDDEESMRLRLSVAVYVGIRYVCLIRTFSARTTDAAHFTCLGNLFTFLLFAFPLTPLTKTKQNKTKHACTSIRTFLGSAACVYNDRRIVCGKPPEVILHALCMYCITWVYETVGDRAIEKNSFRSNSKIKTLCFWSSCLFFAASRLHTFSASYWMPCNFVFEELMFCPFQ